MTMKRFRELVADVRVRYPADDFFADFENSCQAEPLKRKHYRSYNEALMLLDDESWNILKEKAIVHFGNEREGQRKQGFFNQLNEAFAYRYLLHKGFRNIRFMNEGEKKTPDISFLDRGTKSYCEVKTVGISDDEINRRSSHKVYDCGVYFSLGTGFQNKLAADIDRAREQVHTVGDHGLVFILVRFDDVALDHYRRYRKQLTEFCRSRGLVNVIFKIDHRGNKIIRF
jgi:hypothetical protein